MSTPPLDPKRYAQLHAMARRQMAEEQAGNTMQATSLLHEAWLRLAREGGSEWTDDNKLAAAAKTAMRRILIERVRAKRRLKRGGAFLRVSFEDAELGLQSEETTLLVDLDHALDRLRQTDPRACRILELRTFAEFDVARIAELLGVSERTVRRESRTARIWLAHHLRQAQANPTQRSHAGLPSLGQHAS